MTDKKPKKNAKKHYLKKVQAASIANTDFWGFLFLVGGIGSLVLLVKQATLGRALITLLCFGVGFLLILGRRFISKRELKLFKRVAK